MTEEFCLADRSGLYPVHDTHFEIRQPSPRIRALCCFAVAALSGACTGIAAERTAVGVIEEPVVGGTDAAACQWPSTVSVNAWGSCTGTLIHPRIITTAAHCLMTSQTNVFFGAGKNAPGAFSLPATCKAGAQGASGANTSRDWAYCVLPEDDRVKQIPVTPPLVGCEADQFLKTGMDAWVVGFGTISARGGGAGVKRQVPVVVDAIDTPSKGTLQVGDATEGACHGDSGGPLYVHLTDGVHDWGYRVVGSTSGAGQQACDCNCSTVYVNIANHVQAIEDNEHIDVTPCTNSQGTFEASPACNGLVTQLQSGTGTFPQCNVTRTQDPIDTCGVLFSNGGGTSMAGGAAKGGGGTAGAAAANGGMSSAGSPALGSDKTGSGTLGTSTGPTSTQPSSMSSGSSTSGSSSNQSSRGSSSSSSRTGQKTFGTSSSPSGSSSSSDMMPEQKKGLGCQASGAGQGSSQAWPVFCALGLALLRRRKRFLA